MKLQRIEEFLLSPEAHAGIQVLLQNNFPGYPEGQTFFKQLPDFRYLLWQGEILVAHMAVEHRLINNDGQLLRIFGVADLCVATDFQRQKIGSQLLRELEVLGLAHSIDFLVLQAKDQDLYQKNGFQPATNLCQWLLISHQQTLGVARRRLAQSLMIKPLSDKVWRQGLTDFLGHVF
ncbi:MAG TPA: GNAT family N-acetyltransferase [Saprospiraceae bacterium]|nr:GNAT family N-acetyltransferase [Saprospiraceae bacterium]HMP24884.1 GNAT family N-acetyltransferase [Saprospiraceae bacterium]